MPKKIKSYPVVVMAHSGEAIIPVLYAPMVKRFLLSKGISLPLKPKRKRRVMKKK
jgi:hypothetical protein